MRHKTPALFVALIVGWSTPAIGQVPTWVNDILRAAQLPVVTAEARTEGVNNEEIRGVLDAMSKAKVPAHEATAVIDTARAVRREHGPVDNFGAFVQSQLAAGKRGRELAAAIRAEHARMGKGGARGAEKARGKADTASDTARGRTKRGKSGAESRGRDTSYQTPENRGKGRGNPKPER